MSWSCIVLYKIDKSRYYLLLCACVWDRRTHVSHIKISRRPCDRWTLFTCISHAVVVGPDIARKHRCSLVVCFCPSEDRNVSWEKPREVTRHEKASEANRILFFFFICRGLCQVFVAVPSSARSMESKRMWVRSEGVFAGVFTGMWLMDLVHVCERTSMYKQMSCLCNH